MSEGDNTTAGKPQPRIGSYLLVQPLGAGGMSSVFKAVHAETGHEVAVKILPRALAKNPTLLQRFLREAKSAESLEHPNIVSIFDRGVDQGRHYLVLEYVEGGDLHDRVRQGGPLEFGEAIAAIRSIATGLQFAASRGLIHRDIKPANLLMTPSKHVKIIDLGLALHAESEDERVTREGTTVGTVDYMSPEQARDSRATSERSDIYSLGCTFYYLLTGSPPYPGGDISDKLSRHCLAAVPDVRKLRPEVPTSLALLVRRMMAKRPENRFANYQELIDALDVTPTNEEPPTLTSTESGEPVYAVFDDEDEAENANDDSPGAGSHAASEPVFALIDDSGDDLPTELPAGQLELIDDPASAGGVTTPRANPPLVSLPTQLSLAELVALDDEASSPPSPPRRPPSIPPREPVAVPGNLLASALLEDELEEESGSARSLALGGTRRYKDPIRKLILTYTVIALGLVGFIIGVHQLYLASLPSSLDSTAGEDLSEVDSPDRAPEPEPPVASNREPEAPAPPSQPQGSSGSSRRTEKVVVKTRPPAPWVEPGDPSALSLPELEIDPRLERRFVPEWATQPIPDRVGTNFVTVRRVVNPTDPREKHALRVGLEVIGGTIELADDGPFFEDDLRIRGESLLIRARNGIRPIVCVDPPQLDVVRDQPAIFVLDGKSLILDGIDLVVNVPQMPLAQTSLFACKGGTLTLRRCTITVINPRRKAFSLVRTLPSPRTSRVRLEETMVRGTGVSAVEMTGGSSEVVLNRSVLVSGGGAAFRDATTEPAAERTIHVVRSLIASREPVIELVENGRPNRPKPLGFRVLGSVLGQVAGATASPLIASARNAQPDQQLNWLGEQNLYVGWNDWLSMGQGQSANLHNLAAARTIWQGTDSRSRELNTRWQLDGNLERVTPSSLLPIAPESGGTLTRVAAPSPYLFEKSIEEFDLASIPRLANRPPAALPSESEQTARSGSPTPGVPERVVRFNLLASPWHGDLGLFLRDQIRKDDRKIRILVQGGGTYPSTPIRLPDGISIEVGPDPSQPPPSVPITWSAVTESAGTGLIETNGGDLVLTNIRLVRDGSARLSHLIRVDRGHLILNRCWITAPGVVQPGGGNLIAFRAASTEPRPQPAGEGPFQASVDRPTCRLADTLLITGGDAIRAEVGRGKVILMNCALAVGGSAFDLSPTKVARNRFDAELRLEACTVAAESSFVRLGAWPGTDPGPDRPWLVATKDSAFIAGYDRTSTSTESVLLRVEPNSLSRGALLWQSTDDAFDVMNYTARTDSPMVTARRPDVHRQWIKLWGEARMHNVTGPIWPRGSVLSIPSVKFQDRLQSGKVAPSDLELDRNYHPGRTRLSVGADLTKIGVVPRKRDAR